MSGVKEKKYEKLLKIEKERRGEERRTNATRNMEKQATKTLGCPLKYPKSL